ncbi:hypothetical protein [Sphingobium yanoikuyae]|uniref:hypothetical protein n=1 Tax=Sphingobium yanoikuyae TaxID=13690 RepID=UPI0013E07BEA|nr:hypothetical protein [Sphingobium yanoikuyae]
MDRAGSCERCGNTAEGIADLADFVWEHAGDDGLVVLEASGGDCQDFRVWPGIMGNKESHYVTTQRTCHTE